MSDPGPYAAFISYRHVEPDRSVARWLHRALEAYRLPAPAVASGAPLRLGRVFRDEEELAASADLSARIDAALSRSDTLVVICSPRVVESRWVDAEVQRFAALGKTDRIFALLVDGEPGSAFPPALRALGHEPLAADLRASNDEPLRARRRTALLKLVAGLLGIEFDSLRRRDEERRRRRQLLLTLALGALGAVFLVLAGLAVWQWQRAERELAQSRAQNLASQAQIALADAERDKDCFTCPDAQRAALLAIESLRIQPTIAADNVLRRTVWKLSAQTMDRVVPDDGSVWSVDGSGQLVADAAGAAAQAAPPQGGDADLLATSSDGRLSLRRSPGDPSAWSFESADLVGANGRRVALLPHEWPIAAAAFSSDGRWLVTVTGAVSTDASEPSATVLVGSTVRVWSTDRGEERTRLSLAAEDGIAGARLDPNGRWLLSSSHADMSDAADAQPRDALRLRVWPVAPPLLVERACALLKRNLSPSEWSTFVGGEGGWRETCPGLPVVSE